MEHSPTSATGTGWERTPWRARAPGVQEDDGSARVRSKFGPGQKTNLEPEFAWDIVATDFEDLAARLGC
jgi:hypothetical protein